MLWTKLSKLLSPLASHPAATAFAGSFAIKSAYIVLCKTYNIHGDAEMERSAISLVENSTIANVFSPNSGPSAHVAPLYAFLLSGIYAVFGCHSTLGRFVQQLCAALATSAAAALLVKLGCRTGLHRFAGITAALAVAIVPANLWVETSGSWEQPYSALLLVLLLLWFTVLHQNEWTSMRQAAFAGVLIAACALLSPGILPVAAFCGLAEFFVARGFRARVFKGGVLLTAVTLVLVSPWVYRNYTVFGRFVPVRSNFGIEFWLGNHPGANGTAHAVVHEHPYINKAEADKVAEIGEAEYGRRKIRAAKAWIAENPREFVRLSLNRLRFFWVPPPHMWPDTSTGTLIKVAWHDLAGIGAWLGALFLWWRRHEYRHLFLATLLGAPLLYSIAIVEVRHRYPLYGIMLLLGAHVFWSMVTAGRDSKTSDKQVRAGR